MENCSKSEKKPAGVVNASEAPAPKECDSCGLDYCDCEVCDEKVTIQVRPVE